MTTISKTIPAPEGEWVQVDSGYSALTMKRRSTFPVIYSIGAAEPETDEDDEVHQWTSGAVVVRDLGDSHVWVKALNDPNTIEVILSDAAAQLTSASAGFADLILTLDTSAYATGDVLAEAQEIEDVFPSAGSTTALHTISIIDKDDQGQGLDLLFFDSDVSLGTANAAPSISDADAAHFLGVVSVAAEDMIDIGGCQVASLKNIGLALKAAADSRSLFVAAISRGTGTYGAAGIMLRFGFI